jgi:hypothetical protein
LIIAGVAAAALMFATRFAGRAGSARTRARPAA